MMPHTCASNVVWHGMMRAAQPGKPPAASRHRPAAEFRMLVRVAETSKAPTAKQALPLQGAQCIAPWGSGVEQLPITTASPSFGGASTPGVGGITHAMMLLDTFRGTDVENLV